MTPDPEVERLQNVYRGYQKSDAIQLKWSSTNLGNRAILQERAELLGMLLQSADYLPLDNRRILDIGCGSGRVLAGFMRWGAAPQNLYGMDLLPERVEAAQQQFPDLQFTLGNAEHLEFADADFDLVALFTVLSSILETDMARNVVQEVQRVLKPGGAVVWYDFRYNNPWNPHTQAMTKQDMVRFFPDFEMRSRMLTLLPPLARRLGRWTNILYPLLGRIRPLRTHYLALLIKPTPKEV